MSSYTANNKLIYTWTRGDVPVPVRLLTSYAESIIMDGEKRTFWYKGRQYGNSYYGSTYGESFNDFINNSATGDYSHAEGTYTAAKGTASHSENAYNIAYGDYTIASGKLSYAIGEGSHTEGLESVSYGDYSHVEGEGSSSYGFGSHAEGHETQAYSDYSHSEGTYTVAYGEASHAEGNQSVAYREASHAEGNQSVSYGFGSHSEGDETIAYGDYSHSEGTYTVAYGEASHAEGNQSVSYGLGSHSEGDDTIAYGDYSHSEGTYTVTYGEASHAEGKLSYAIGDYSNTVGEGTQAYNKAEFAAGQWNVSYDGEDGIHEQTIFTIGNGTSYEERSNAVEVTKNAAYVSVPSYFGAYIHGSISYSYVDYYHGVTMEQLMHALLDGEEQYTEPVLYTYLSYFIDGYANPIPALDDNIIVSYDGSVNIRTVMEVGTSLKADANLFWPLSTLGGTRSSVGRSVDYDTVEPVLLGYSYGLNNSIPGQGAYVSVNHYGEIPEYSDHSLNKVTYFGSIDRHNSSTYITFLNTVSTDDNPFNVIGNMYASCDESTYMLYSRLKKQGAVQISYDGWFDKQVIEIPFNWSVDARYRWFAGITTELPATVAELRQHDSGFLNYPAEDIYSVITHKVTEAESQNDGYFWVAVPQVYDRVMMSDIIDIEVRRGDGIIWDLVSPQQPSNVKYAQGVFLTVPIGENAARGITPPTALRKTQKYDIHYVNLTAGPLGHDTVDEIRVKFVGTNPAELKNLLLTDENYKILMENESAVLEYDAIEE